MTKHNAAIYLLSSRVKDLEICLKYLHENWNNKHGYPVYVNHFDDIYSEEYISDIKKKISNNIYFEQIPYDIPTHIPESELFYNRRYLEYVRNSFPPSRVGYLHMEHYVNNINRFGEKGCPTKSLSKYDYLMRIDDDSWFKEEIGEDLFDHVVDSPMATAFTWNHYGQGHLDTRENLWSFYLEYLEKANIKTEEIKNTQLRIAVENKNEMLIHSLNWSCGNLNIYNLRLFEEKGFDFYLDMLNKNGGAYKHRWGDLEVLGLFGYTNFDTPLVDLGLREKGLYLPKLPTSGYAPSTRGKK
jgi:hypothetical protein